MVKQSLDNSVMIKVMLGTAQPAMRADTVVDTCTWSNLTGESLFLLFIYWFEYITFFFNGVRNNTLERCNISFPPEFELQGQDARTDAENNSRKKDNTAAVWNYCYFLT